MMQIRYWTAVVLGWLVLVTSGCTFQLVKTVEIGDQAQMGRRVLIATEYSEFKTTVVDGIIDALKSDALYVKVIDVSRLKGETAADYDAVVIVNTCMAWNLSPEVLAFIGTIQKKDRLIVLATAGDEKWKPNLTDVDAVTSASQMETADQVTMTVVNKLRTVLSARI